jgi:CHAT domain-containing protein/tetratricopeptide (TPR) repeat protein
VGGDRWAWREATRCPDGEALAAYLDDLLTHEQRARMEEHLADCGACRELVAGAARMVVEVEAGRRSWSGLSPRQWALSAAGGLAALIVGVALLVPRMPGPAEAPPELIAGDSRSVVPRLTRLPDWAPPPVVRRSRAGRDASGWSYLAAGDRLRAGAGGTTAEQIGALGAAQLLGGDVDEAIESLRRASAAAPGSPDLLSDLGAATIARGEQLGEAEDLVIGLETASRALVLSPRHREALFNRALALEELRLPLAASEAWEELLAVERSAGWRREAEGRLAELRPQPRTTMAAVEASMLAAATAGEPGRSRLAAAVDEHRHVARRLFQERLLPGWGDALLAGDAAEAGRQLDTAGAIAAAWARSTGDRSLELAVDEARGATTMRARELAKAHAAVGAAYRLLATDPAEAHAAAGAAVRTLLARRSSAAGWARLLLLTCRYFLLAPGDPVLEGEIVALLAEQHLDPATRAQALSLQGLVLAERGEMVTGLQRYRDALSLYQDLGERDRVAWTRYLISEALSYLGDSRAAWRYRQPAIADVPLLVEEQRRANILFGSAAAALLEGRSHTASALLAEVVAGEPLDDPALAGQVHLWRSRTRAANNDLAGAREDLLAASSRMPAMPSFLRSRFGGELQVARGLAAEDPVVAIAAFDRALRSAEAAGSQLWSPHLLLERARARQRRGDESGAKTDLLAALVKIEAVTAEGRGTDLWALRPRVTEAIVDALVVQSLARGGVEEAFGFAERGKARALLAALGDTRRAGSLGEVAARLDAGTALLVYSLAGTGPVLWRIERGSHRLVELRAERSELARWASVLSVDLAAGSWTDTTRQAAEGLYRALIAPAQVRPGTRLVLVPDGELHEVPFAALRDAGRHRFLVEDHVLSIAPSASVYLAARERGWNLTVAAAERSALVLGNPLPDWRAYPSLEPLPGAREEAERVAAAYPRRKLRVGEAATREALLAEIGHHQVLHFAGHALPNRVSPSLAALALAPAGSQAGSLSAGEISALQLAGLRVVVLSACATGTGSIAAGEGPLSLARAFLAAEVPAVVATTWPIADGTAAPLMVALHQRLSRGEEPAVALRGAQLALLRSGRPELSSPASWAAAELFGS